MRSVVARTDRYTRVAIALHWVIAALIIFNLWLGLAHESLPRAWQVIPVHKSIGLTVLALTLARIGWRLAHPVPALPGNLTRWERLAANASHVLLYALMLVLPLTGWALASGGKRYPLNWFGLFDVPYLPVSNGASRAAHDLHGLFGWAMLGLIVLHVAAALRHHFMLRDNVLARMTPGVRPPEPRLK